MSLPKLQLRKTALRSLAVNELRRIDGGDGGCPPSWQCLEDCVDEPGGPPTGCFGSCSCASSSCTTRHC